MAQERKQPFIPKVAVGEPFYELVQEAYRVFAYPKPQSIEVCEGCCMDADIEADFFNPRIGDLPLSYVQDWYFAAYDPNGIAKATWGYLLPRVLEILAYGEDVSNTGPEVSLNRFATGVAANWSVEEWSVLDRFQRLYLNRALTDDMDEALDDVLCMFALAGWPLQDLLDQVAAQRSAVLAHRFWRDWCAGRVPGRESVWMTAFWESPARTEVFDFYTSRAMYRRLQQLAFADDTPPDLSEKALAVAAVIEANASWNQPSA